MKLRLNSWFIVIVITLMAAELKSQGDSVFYKKRKNQFGIDIGVGKPPVRYFTEDFIKENRGYKKGNFNNFTKPVSYSHIYLSYHLNKKNLISYNFYLGAFLTHYQLKTYGEWYETDSVFVYGVSSSNEKQTSFSAGFSISKKFKLNKNGKLFFAPEVGVFINRLAFEYINVSGVINKYRVVNNFPSLLDTPIESSKFEDSDRYSLFNAPSDVDDLFGISPTLRMALIKQCKAFNLQINFNMVFLPYYSFIYYQFKSSWQFSNVSVGIYF